MQISDLEYNGFIFSTDKSRVDIPYVHRFLSEKSYWAKGIPIEFVKRSIENSISFGIYTVVDNKEKQVGFARVVTDLTTFAYLADVFVDEEYRGKGLSKKLMEFILSVPEFSTLRRFILATADAHSLYSQFSFEPLKKPERFMEIARPDLYLLMKN